MPIQHEAIGSNHHGGTSPPYKKNLCVLIWLTVLRYDAVCMMLSGPQETIPCSVTRAGVGGGLRG